ncbi:MAG: hypothetical protein A3G81_09760 [Betaproteobacteria bacterium RIFCSPLOWO2_12_FULL_65_14]|nr:MAG: hypothetical protein A3G81_09760 [Betaproteobacteria bacterium RIFCSPLOWO2_12_FULL_65_14]
MPSPSPWRKLGRIFLTGLLTVLPLVATVYFTVWLLNVLERFFGKQVMFLLPDEWYRTGMGLVLAIAVVFGVGLLMNGIVFRRAFGWAEWVLLEIPLVRSVYSALRDLLGLFAHHKEPALQVVSVALPGNLRLLGFVTRSDFSDAPPGIAQPGEVAVYLPMSYQLGGYTVFVPKSALTPVDMSREEAMKFVLTAGLKAASPAVEPPGSGIRGQSPNSGNA